MPKKKLDYAALFTLRKDGRYMWRYTDEDGKRHAVYDRDPEALHKKMESVLNAPAEPPMSFSAVAEEWEGKYRESVTVRSWLNLKPHYEDLKKKFKGCGIEEITAQDINADYLAAKAKGYSRTVVNNRRVILNGIFNYALVSGYIPVNPATAVKLPKNLPHGKRTAPTDEEIKIICSNIDKPFGFFPFFLLLTGLRKSEALALLKTDIDFKKKTILINKTLVYIDNANPTVKEPKTEAGKREVPIIAALLAPLKKYCAATKSNYLFPQPQSNRGGGKGGYMTERGYEGAWRRYCASVGLVDSDGKPTITAHQLRHGTATLLFESGADEFTAQHILGHANINITMSVYTELREKQKTKSVKKFNDLVSTVVSKTDKKA